MRSLALQDVYAALGVKGLLRFAILRVLSWVQAGLAHLHYGYLDWIARQSNPFTATDEWLVAWAALKAVVRKDSSPAQGIVSMAAASPTFVPAGTVLRRGGDGAGYVTLADATVSAGTLVHVGAQVAGAVGNADADTQLALASPVSGVTAVSLATPLVGGADQELDASLRTRMLLAYSSPPQGGAAGDYVQWALAVPGVTRAWCNPLGVGAGTIVVYTMWDASEAAHGGFPQGADGVASGETRSAPASGDQLVVANAIYPLRPVTALVYSCAPVAMPINFSLHCATPVVAGSTVDLALRVAIDGVFVALADPLATEVQLDQFQVAVAAVPGMPDFTITAPAAAIFPAIGRLPVRGTVTYV